MRQRRKPLPCVRWYKTKPNTAPEVIVKRVREALAAGEAALFFGEAWESKKKRRFLLRRFRPMETPEESFESAFHRLAEKYGRKAIFFYAPKVDDTNK